MACAVFYASIYPSIHLSIHEARFNDGRAAASAALAQRPPPPFPLVAGSIGGKRRSAKLFACVSWSSFGLTMGTPSRIMLFPPRCGRPPLLLPRQIIWRETQGEKKAKARCFFRPLSLPSLIFFSSPRGFWGGGEGEGGRGDD